MNAPRFRFLARLEDRIDALCGAIVLLVATPFIAMLVGAALSLARWLEGRP